MCWVKYACVSEMGGGDERCESLLQCPTALAGQ